MAIKRIRCVKFIDSYDNSSLLKPDNNTINPEYLITYEGEPDNNPETEGEGQITNFFEVENFKFGSVGYCCTRCMILANYSEAVNSPDSNKWILAMRENLIP